RRSLAVTSTSFRKTSIATNLRPGCTTHCFNLSPGPATAPYSDLATPTHFVSYTPDKAVTLPIGITSEEPLNTTVAFVSIIFCFRLGWPRGWRVVRSTKDRELWINPRITRLSSRTSATNPSCLRNPRRNWYYLSNGRFGLDSGLAFGRANRGSSSAALCPRSRHALDHNPVFPGAARHRRGNSHLTPTLLLG